MSIFYLKKLLILVFFILVKSTELIQMKCFHVISQEIEINVQM